jgi:hypothetical protein
MDSNNSQPIKSKPQNSGSRQKRIYLKQGILESREDFAKRFVRTMVEEGMLPPEKLPPPEPPDDPALWPTPEE